MTQPAFSQQIRSLERRLGVTLVDRTTRTAGLTAAGHGLLPEIRTAVEAADRLRQAAAEHHRSVSGRVRIGTVEAITALPPVPEILETLTTRNPGIGIEILHLGYGEYAEALLEGAVDAAFVFLPAPSGIRTERLATMPRVVCMAAGSPLAHQGPLTLDRLAGLPVIGFPPTVPKVYRDFWTVDPRPDGSPVDHTPHRITAFEPTLTAIALGKGIQFCPEPARRLYQRPGIAYVDVTDLSPCSTALAWRHQDHERPLVRALRQATREACGPHR